jgi:hypothetical protein
VEPFSSPIVDRHYARNFSFLRPPHALDHWVVKVDQIACLNTIPDLWASSVDVLARESVSLFDCPFIENFLFTSIDGCIGSKSRHPLAKQMYGCTAFHEVFDQGQAKGLDTPESA